MPALRRSAHRSGTILIIVAGIAALLASLALAFLTRMRADSEEMALVVRESQARIMLLAACNYVQEASRLGYDDVVLTGAHARKHKEAFGWIDVRDGAIGPRTEDWDGDGAHDLCYSTALVEDGDGNGSRDRPAWPAPKSVVRCPMYVMERPPYANQLTATYNPIQNQEGVAFWKAGYDDFGNPWLRNPDPQPVIANGWTGVATPGTVNATRWNEYAAGNRTPRSNSLNLGWFRVYRDGDATFVVTCGSGGSWGFRDWDEVVGADEEDLFSNDRSYFEDLVAEEMRLWYRIEWNAAVMALDYHLLDHSIGRERDHYLIWPFNSAHVRSTHEFRTQTHAKNMVGTIRWVQRLRSPPTFW